MNFKRIILGSSVALAGFLTVATAEQAEAASWSARSVEEIKADFKVENKKVVSYTVQYGDTLSAIAKAANVNTNALAEINKIANANLIYPGTELSFKVDKAGKVNQVAVESNGKADTYAVSGTKTRKSYSAPAQNSASYVGSSSSAKSIIAQRESGNNYNARNGQYIGKYQLSASYLGGDYSPANQERVADRYVASRYGSWDNALAFWNSHGWY